jgi:hypothetical protein
MLIKLSDSESDEDLGSSSTDAKNEAHTRANFHKAPENNNKHTQKQRGWIEEGREFMAKARHHAFRNAKAAAKRIPVEYGRDPVAETMAFWDKEIEGYENGIWLTQASSVS